MQIILVGSVITKYIVSNSSRFKENGRTNLDLGDLVLIAFLFCDAVGIFQVTKNMSLDTNPLKILLAIVTIVLINRTAFKFIIKKSPSFMKHPDISAGGVARQIAYKKGITFGVLALIMTASGSFLEELIFRMLLGNLLGGAILQASIFGLAHAIPMYCGGLSAKTSVACFFITFLDGLVLGVTYLQCGLLTSWIVHWMVNYIAAMTDKKMR